MASISGFEDIIELMPCLHVFLRPKAMEENESKGGFVKFTSTSAKPQTVSIPEHLRSGLPDPLAHLANKKAALSASKSGGRVTGDSARLKAELAKLQKKRQETALRIKALNAKAKASSTLAPPPPPSLAFGASKKTNR